MALPACHTKQLHMNYLINGQIKKVLITQRNLEKKVSVSNINDLDIFKISKNVYHVYCDFIIAQQYNYIGVQFFPWWRNLALLL